MPARRTDAKSSPQVKASKTEVARVDPGGATAPEDATHRRRKRRRPTRRLPRSIEAAEDEVESDVKHHPRRKQAQRDIPTHPTKQEGGNALDDALDDALDEAQDDAGEPTR